MWDGVLRGTDAIDHDIHEKERRKQKCEIQGLQNKIDHLKKENKSYKKEVQKLQDEIKCLKENMGTDELVSTNLGDENMNTICEVISLHVMDSFEDFLDEHDITIPCESESDEEYRIESNTNARIYGDEYVYLEDRVCDKIKHTMMHLIRKYTKKQNNSSLKGDRQYGINCK